MTKYPRSHLSPEDFKLFAKRTLDAESSGLHEYRSKHREIIPGADGQYEIDITVRFSALGADYLTLIECKYYKNAVKREQVQALQMKIQSVGAHKGIIFAAKGFQSGATQFAESHGIALVQVMDGRSSYLARMPDKGI
jgi:restriction system protein